MMCRTQVQILYTRCVHHSSANGLIIHVKVQLCLLITLLTRLWRNGESVCSKSGWLLVQTSVKSYQGLKNGICCFLAWCSAFKKLEHGQTRLGCNGKPHIITIVKKALWQNQHQYFVKRIVHQIKMKNNFVTFVVYLQGSSWDLGQCILRVF